MKKFVMIRSGGGVGTPSRRIYEPKTQSSLCNKEMGKRVGWLLGRVRKGLTSTLNLPFFPFSFIFFFFFYKKGKIGVFGMEDKKILEYDKDEID